LEIHHRSSSAMFHFSADCRASFVHRAMSEGISRPETKSARPKPVGWPLRENSAVHLIFLSDE
jgi:hypothetical protein